MRSKFRSLIFIFSAFLIGLTPASDYVIIDGKKIEIVRVGPGRVASGDLRAVDARSGKELWTLQVTKPYKTGTTVGGDRRAALVSLSQAGNKLMVYDDQSNLYVIDPASAKIEFSPVP